MPRKGKVVKRTPKADAKYGSVLVSKIINGIMLDGKKVTATKIVYGALDIIAEKSGEEAIEVLNQALENIKPTLEVKSRRIGGANYQVPVEVREDRKETLGIRWLVNYSRLRNERNMDLRLANEILDAAKGTGQSVKKKDDTHRMAEANRAFAHYRW